MDTDHTAPGQSAVRPPAPVDGNVRERLLNNAARLFARKGYAATTVREIVAEAGVTKPVLYYYFRSKEGIYSELLQEALKRFEALLEEARQRRGRAVERLLFLTDRVLALYSVTGLTRRAGPSMN